MSVRNRSKRKLGFQSLERRQLLAAHISEILVDPLFGDNNTEQYIELRGEPNETLPEGSYFVVVSERRPNEGEIHGIFDLSGQSFGSNGYLAILQHEHPFEINPASNALVSTSDAFAGLPGGIYSDSHTLSNRIDFIIGANTYMLIQTDTAPGLDQNIDADGDGAIDESILQSWDIWDSISLHSFVGRGDHAYGQIVFAEIGTGPGDIAVAEGVELIHTEGFGYAGRVGESTGHRATDWVASTAQDESRPNEQPQWALADNLFGEPSQYPYAGRDLDHVGEANFVGGIRGVVSLNSSGEPTEGVTVLADINGNGVRDSLTYVVNPDDVVDHENPLDENGNEKDYPLINAYPNVTVTNFALDAFPAHAVTAEKERDFPNTLENRIFAKGGIDWFTRNGTLRFDFYRPVNSVSIVAIGSDNSLSEVYGRIDAYNADGELIDTDVSSLLLDSQRETISVQSSSDNIAYVFAYADEDHNDGEGGPFGRFDHMIYSQQEPTATTDENGYYEIQHLFPGEFQVSVLANELVSDIRPVSIPKYENHVENFSLAPNQAPVIQAANFELPENSPANTSVGFISASDPNGQTLSYRIAEGQGDLGLVVNEVTGEINVAPNSTLDFEATPVITFSVVATDPLGADAAANVTVSLLDLNEPPTAEFGLFRMLEFTEVGAVIGTINASDPDTDANQVLVYEIIGGSGAEDFVINAQTGEISLARLQDVTEDFEKTLQIRVSDSGAPALSTTVGAVVLVENQNGAPIVESSTFAINESDEGGAVIGTVTAADDPEQVLTYSIDGDSDLFAIHPETGELTVKEGASFDFETTTQYTVVVVVTDDGSPVRSASAEQTIQVFDNNEIPTIVTTSLTVSESAAFGGLVGTIEASDPDEGQSFTYELVGGSGDGLFLINSNSGLVTVSTTDGLDFETAPELELEVRVTDNGAPALSSVSTIVVTVEDANEAPVFITESLEIAENSTGELTVIQAEDPDAEQTLTYELIGGDAQDLVSLTSDGTLVLRDDASLDFEAGNNYSLEVRVSDNGDPALFTTQTIPLLILNENEAPAFQGELTPPEAMSGERFEYAIAPGMIVDPEGQEFTVEATIPGASLPEWLTFDPFELVFHGIPSSFFAGTIDITVRAFHADAPDVASDITLQLVVGLSEKPLHNVELPHDVNGDNSVSASDALRIINYISRNGTEQQIDESVRQTAFFDVTGDNFVTSLDALRVINEMRRSELSGSTNAEAVVAISDDDDDAHDRAIEAYLQEASLF